MSLYLLFYVNYEKRNQNYEERKMFIEMIVEFSKPFEKSLFGYTMW